MGFYQYNEDIYDLWPKVEMSLTLLAQTVVKVPPPPGGHNHIYKDIVRITAY